MAEDQVQTEVTFRFVVNQVSTLNKPVQSPPCYLRNLSWTLKVYPPTNDTNEETERSLGVFLFCNSESSSWACYAVAEFCLLSVRPGVTPFTMKSENLFYSEGERGWGFPSFMPLTDVLDTENGYIKDDSITLEVHIVEGNGIIKKLRDLEEQLEKERKRRTVDREAHKKSKDDLLKDAETKLELLHEVIDNTLKNTTQDSEEAWATQDELAATNKNKKRSALEVELLQLTEDLSSSERARRAIKAERVELQEEISNGISKANLLENKKRRLEVKIATLEDELVEAQNNIEVIADKLRKTQLSAQSHELNSFLLECQNRELSGKLSKLEGKITTLEEQFEVEVKECLIQQKQSRNLDKKLKELDIQFEDKKCQSDYYKEQVEKMNVRVQAVNRRLEEVEEENGREKAQKRKAQSDLEAMVEFYKSMTGEISNLKSTIRRNTEGMDLPSSRNSECGSLQTEGNESGDDWST